MGYNIPVEHSKQSGKAKGLNLQPLMRIGGMKSQDNQHRGSKILQTSPIFMFLITLLSVVDLEPGYHSRSGHPTAGERSMSTICRVAHHLSFA